MDQKEVTESPCDINYEGDCALCNDNELSKYKRALYKLTDEAIKFQKERYDKIIENLENYLSTLNPKQNEILYTNALGELNFYKGTIGDIEPYIQCYGTCITPMGLHRCKRNAYYDVKYYNSTNNIILVNEILFNKDLYLRRRYCYQHAVANKNPCNTDNRGPCRLCDDATLEDYKTNLYKETEHATLNIRKKYIEQLDSLKRQIEFLPPIPDDPLREHLKQRRLNVYQLMLFNTEPYIQCTAYCRETEKCKRNSRYDVVKNGEIIFVANNDDANIRRKYCLQHANAKSKILKAIIE